MLQRQQHICLYLSTENPADIQRRGWLIIGHILHFLTMATGVDDSIFIDFEQAHIWAAQEQCYCMSHLTSA